MNALDRVLLKAAVDARVRALTDNEHDGDAAGYRRGCRCPGCRAASTAYKRKQRQRGIDVRTHNASGYKNGCRCGECRLGYAAWASESRSRQRESLPGTSARKHSPTGSQREGA